MREEKKKYSDVESVRRIKNQIIPEEFPEGSYGSAINKYEAPEGKSTPWLPGQYRESAFVFPDKSQHANLPRQADGAHPTHSENEEHSTEN
ncbi:hypothetical protein [Oceanobacillus sp. CAU 1775]